VVAASSVLLPAFGWFVGQDVRGIPVATVAAIEQGSFLVAGATLIWKAPRNRVGALLYLIGLFDLSALGIYSDIAAIDTISWILLGTSDILLVVLILTYPTGRFEDRLDRLAATAILGLLTFTWGLELVAADPSLARCHECLENPFRVLDPAVRAWWGRNVLAIAQPVGGLAVTALVVRRWRRSSRPARIRLTPLLAIGLAAAILGTLDIALETGGTQFGPLSSITSPLIRAFIPIALAVGLLRMWRRRLIATGRVASLASDLTPQALGPAVASALGDPRATVLLWSPALGGYLDGEGRAAVLPPDPASRTVITEGPEPVAAIVHDPALAEDPGLLAAVGSAVRLAILRDRLRSAVQEEASVADGLRTGETIGGFRILGTLGRGGMGLVYLAEDPILGRQVALKVLVPAIATEPGFRERFEREARLAGSLDHPNVVSVLSAGEDAGRLFIAMRFIDGPDLSQRLSVDGPMPPEEAVRVIEQVAAALDAAHELGIVHRDVKTSNILMSAADRVYLADFGLARPTAAGATITRTGGFVGSLDTMAPERVRGEAAGPASDIYALGCVLFECVAGRPPFDDGGELARLWAHLQAPVPRLSDENPTSPRGLDAVVVRALAKEPKDRFVSAGALATAARAALSQSVPPPATR
jgi:predicted Ser/Thr protein kinase